MSFAQVHEWHEMQRLIDDSYLSCMKIVPEE